MRQLLGGAKGIRAGAPMEGSMVGVSRGSIVHYLHLLGARIHVSLASPVLVELLPELRMMLCALGGLI